MALETGDTLRTDLNWPIEVANLCITLFRNHCHEQDQQSINQHHATSLYLHAPFIAHPKIRQDLLQMDG
jgi:hypothetical protein